MTSLKWISSEGGPFVILPEEKCELWSGTYKSISEAHDELEEANNFLDPTETDYGKACLIEDYIGAIDWNGEKIMVLGDEPVNTTVFKSNLTNILFARLYYGKSERIVEDYLNKIEPASISDWEYSLSLPIKSECLYVLDSAIEGKLIKEEEVKLNKVFIIKINSGLYDVFTSIYEPCDSIKLILHWLKK